eukprot:885066-Pyramimonas_sp.AAC.1
MRNRELHQSREELLCVLLAFPEERGAVRRVLEGSWLQVHRMRCQTSPERQGVSALLPQMLRGGEAGRPRP